MNQFGVKQTLNKQERAYVNKVKKQDLIKEAMNLDLMVDDKMNKSQLFNVIKQKKRELQPVKRKETKIVMSDLFDELPQDAGVPITRLKNEPYREYVEFPIAPSHRLPAGSKEIRRERGLTKTQKTIIRRQIYNEIDYLAELLKKLE